jgi:triosephosphate isomerase (TIM)
MKFSIYFALTLEDYSMRKRLIAGNWKMNGSSASIALLLEGLVSQCTSTDVDWLVCPPFVYVPQAREALKGSSILLGAQNVCDRAAGAYTGEISADMLKDVGCDYAIVGHSERRQVYRECEGLVAARFKAALDAGITPILCVGETLEEHEAGNTLNVVFAQLKAVFDACSWENWQNSVIAYEPVWAIGTGKTATPKQAQEVHEAIRKKLKEHDADFAGSVRILYGGSVKPANASELFAMPDIDGALVGGASLNAQDFSEIK